MPSRYKWTLFIVLLLLTSVAPAQTSRPVAQAVVRIGMTVDDMDRSLDFYTSVLDFQKKSDVEVAGEAYERLFGVFGMRARIVALQLGDEQLELTEYLTPRGREIPRDSRSNDRWFQHIAIVTSDMDRAYEHLRRHKARHASTGPQRLPEWNRNAAGIRAFYFKDPDDHVLEVISFPQGKGDDRWQSRGSLFLGIDHTAIVVADTDRSLAFYRDLLGLRVAGGSENFGTEQEHLNSVFGARLRITTLRTAKGPRIELLEYLAPRDGRPYPADARSNDLFHWHTTIHLPDPNPHDVALPDRQLGFNAARMIADPDGHVLELIAE
jgi:catechol 2,3-dioxygenase-like lactoylglutathione lyase family enzyme